MFKSFSSNEAANEEPSPKASSEQIEQFRSIIAHEDVITEI